LHNRPGLPINDLARHFGPIAGALARAATAVVESGWYSLGPYVRAFEAAFADACGVDHCIGVASGTDALELALRACGAGPGKQVVTVANAGGYSTTAILATGAEPAFADIVSPGMLMDTSRLKGAITAETSAVIATHLYGRMMDMPAVLDIADSVPVIEDCAQAHGAHLGGRPAGSWGTAGCFSFYPTKNLGAVGDGGAVVTSDPEVARSVRQLRQYGWSEKYHNSRPGGRNSRLDEIQAALLAVQLPLLAGWNDRRRDISRRYTAELKDAGVTVAPAGGPEYVAHLYVIASNHRDGLRQHLGDRGIATDVHYPVPDHLQAAWRGEVWTRVSLPETEAAATRVLTIPCFPEMTEDEVKKVITAIQESPDLHDNM
jgi:dTDP-4-amino-4,6-dideoxygalactose transaminase